MAGVGRAFQPYTQAAAVVGVDQPFCFRQMRTVRAALHVRTDIGIARDAVVAHDDEIGIHVVAQRRLVDGSAEVAVGVERTVGDAGMRFSAMAFSMASFVGMNVMKRP